MGRFLGDVKATHVGRQLDIMFTSFTAVKNTTRTSCVYLYQFYSVDSKVCERCIKGKSTPSSEQSHAF